MAFNDVDFCLRVQQAGYRNIWTPYAELYHHESISRGAEDSPEKLRRFNSEVNYMLSKWAPPNSGSLPTCPHYSPYLNNQREDFSLSCSVSSTVQTIRRMPFGQIYQIITRLQDHLNIKITLVKYLFRIKKSVLTIIPCKIKSYSFSALERKKQEHLGSSSSYLIAHKAESPFPRNFTYLIINDIRIFSKAIEKSLKILLTSLL